VSARELLAELGSRGVEVAADGDMLRYRPKAAVTEEVRAALAEHKPHLLKLLERERRKLEDADRRGFVAKWSRKPGWISLHDPISGEWHDWPAKNCFPSIVAEANKHRRKGGAA
jgi:TubC N-terminal docking domain